MSNSEITQEMWRDWQLSPVTKAFFGAIREERDQVRDSIPHINPQDQPELIGRIMRLKSLDDILQIDLGEEE